MSVDETIRLPDDAVLIVGAGLAGLFLALKLAPRRAVVVSPSPLGERSASAWAQGGLAAALGPDDDPELHARDTIAAGAGLVDPVVASLIAREGPARVLDLLALGVPFDTTPDGHLALSLEAAHSRPRVARVKGDLAGKAIMEALIGATRSAENIAVHEGLAMNALLHDGHGGVGGALCTDRNHRTVRVEARETVLAVGGVGGLYRVTTNPVSALGVALAAAFRIGATISDPEFVQFHPTAIDIARDPAPLATEALRGDGAFLIDRDGRRFMADYDPQGDLAARDIVARAIHSEISAGRGAFLDARTAVGAHFPEMFPTVFAACMSAGVDPRTMPIPVAPAAHYHMGGVATDLWGKTSAENLSAVGECASTGAHGANRLASNSLLEAVVFARRIAERLREDASAPARATCAAVTPTAPADLVETLRKRMSAHAGVVREEVGLSETAAWIAANIAAYGPANPLVAAQLIVNAALQRHESRGGHYRQDFPALAPEAMRTFITRAPVAEGAAA
ncbi:MAG: L-aspartate oxidase [Alphaproteobacteria bacterium]|nr:MAG: L-aspartate oxidase [Alphaproteobacteria bacterium]